jgi:hypothetical protein
MPGRQANPLAPANRHPRCYIRRRGSYGIDALFAFGVLAVMMVACVVMDPLTYLFGNSMNRATFVLLATVLLATGADSPVFVTSDPNGGWSNGGYYVHNNMWNSAKYSPCTSTLHAWSADNWYVVAKMDNEKGDGAVKTYPNVHKDYGNVPIDSVDSMTSNFAETSSRVGIYNFAYDIWINGIAKPGCTEIMIWNENFNQTPGGSYMQDVTLEAKPTRFTRIPTTVTSPLWRRPASRRGQ